MKIVSIIVPCFNHGEFLAETLTSVFNQSYKHWECIIVNDGSNDWSEHIALEWSNKDDRFIYYTQSNQGVSVARNNGIKKSTGSYILPLDADDVIHENYLEEAIITFENNPNLKLVYCNGKKFGLENESLNLNKYNYKDLLLGNMIFCSAMFKKTDFYNTSGYDNDMHNGLEDWEFWIRFLDQESKVIKLEKEYFFYRIRENSRNTIKSELHRNINWQIFLKNIDIYKSHYIDPISQIKLSQTYKNMYQFSLDYRLGNFIINPFRKIKNWLFSKNEFRKKNPY
ncbi:glycosyltransferase family A protein [Pedobacter sp. Leaf132]|uniref:glycosyltransferase family 2 protein n=1 Tax=Pedobacter sp. Leaf132 TaxID=2876557 RepID=UPI001E307C71|nr:glycosyltransferase family A protein [Pedobacter sp. Leaf132]